jgi:antitoxin ParD1/3/4
MSTTKRLVVDLPSELVTRVRDRLDSGDFSSESELVGAVLTDWLEADELSNAELANVRVAVAEGIAQGDAGELIEAREVHADLDAQIRSFANSRK